MSTTMPHDEARAKRIQGFMKSQSNDKGGEEKLPRAKMIVKGKAAFFPIYQFRLPDLYYNKANGRIKAEVSEIQAELSRISCCPCEEMKTIRFVKI